MAEADPLNPAPNPPPAAASAADEPAPVKISRSTAARLFAAGRAPGHSARPAWEPPSVAELQRALPQYEIRALIGRGGMGAVYRGMQRSLDREVAIKILPPEIMEDDPQFAVRFQQEARAMARLTHRGIVTVHEAGETADGLLYFVMEYVEGTDVQAMLAARSPLPPEEALPIVAHICEALEFAHESGFIHRDIKPSNIIVDRHGQVKVADFGLARIAAGEGEGLTGSRTLIGTAEFVAPEAFKAGVQLDRRADIYALGVMLYQMLTGTLPRGRFELPSRCVAGLDPRLDAIVDKAMQTERDRRYSTALELRADVNRILGVATGPSGRLAAPERAPLARGRVVGGIALVAAMVLAVGGVVWWSRSGGAPGGDDAGPAGETSASLAAKKAVAEEMRHRWKPVPSKHNAPMDRGAVHLMHYDTWNASRFRMTNGAIRATIAWQPSPPGHNELIKVTARLTDTEHYYACLYGSVVELGYYRAPGMIALQRWPVDPPPGPDEAISLQLACVGHRLVVWVRDRVVGVVDDSTVTAAANVGIQAVDGHIQSLEYLDLDDLSEAEAFRRLGLEASGASAIEGVSAKPAGATKEAPFVNTLGMKFVPVPIIGGPSGGQRVLFSVWETRVQDFEIFAKESKREWSPPKFSQGPTHPAVGVSWEEAEAFCTWLTERERKAGGLSARARYRLPSDHEWSCAIGIGEREDAAKAPASKAQAIADVYPWGTTWPPPPDAGNYSGEEVVGNEMSQDQKFVAGYRDGFPQTAAVGSFPANRFGLFDLGGNAWELCEDLWKSGDALRVMRGGSFGAASRIGLLSCYRDSFAPDLRTASIGFRVVLAASSSAAAPARQWEKVFPDLSKIPNLAEFKDGWARVSEKGGIKQLEDREGQPLALHNGGVRVQRRVPENWHGGTLLHVRTLDEGRRLNLCYYEPKAPGEQGYLQLREFRPETLPPNATAEQAFDLQKLLAERRIPPIGTEFTTELVVVGNTARGRLGTHTVSCTVEDRGKAGRVAIDEANRQFFREVEVLNLDGLAEAEARKAAGLAADPGGTPAVPTPAPRSVTAPAARWRDALAEAPLKEVIAKAEHTAQGYLLPEQNHWKISPKSVRTGALRVRASSSSAHFVCLCIFLDDGGVQRVRFREPKKESVLSRGAAGAVEIDVAVRSGISCTDGQPHEVLFARHGGQLWATFDGQMIHQEPDPNSVPGKFAIAIFGDARIFVDKVEYLDLDNVPDAAARELLKIQSK